MNKYLFLLALIILPSVGICQASEIQKIKAKNLSSCLTGKYPSLCNHNLLSPSERIEVRRAEFEANYQTCISGKYTSLCKHNLLTEEQATAVKGAEHRENLKTCATGKYPALCKHHMLSGKEREIVRRAEQQENFKTCLSGLTPSLCKHNLLSPKQLSQVKKSEAKNKGKRVKLARQFAQYQRATSNPSGCVDGHWITDVSSNGSIVTLEDGSIWEVNGIDTYKSAIWLPISQIVACDNLLINKDDGEKVLANRLK